jgi:succinate-acetate transporter protein
MPGEDGARPEERASMRIVVRPLGNPLPLGMFSFGIGMLLLAAESAGWVPVGEDMQIGILLAAFVFPLEALAAVMAFVARDTLAATVLGLFTTSWLALGLVLITGTPGAISTTEGIYLLGFAGAVSSLALLAAAGKPLIALTLVLSAARALLFGLYEVTRTPALEHAAGYVAAAIAAVAWYAGTAFAFEEVRGRPLLPVLRRGASAAAVNDDLPGQLAHARQEPGVRQQL